MVTDQPSHQAPDWVPDPVLPGYEYLRLDLPDVSPAIGESEDLEITASLVRRNPPRHRRAVLYLHGWSDYFFQTWMADFFDAIGYDFHALELRRYGRGLTEGMLGGYVSDLSDYFTELDLAYAEVTREHDEVTVLAHSTGGLVASLWVDERPGQVNGLMLNSPWLDWHGSPLMRVATEAIAMPFSLTAKNAARTLPVPDTGNYMRSIHSSLDGEWDFDFDLKRHPSFTIRPGWVNAILAGHKKVRQGLSIDTPVLSMRSASRHFGRTWCEKHQTCDVVLEVDKLARRSVQLGPHVTVMRFDGGLHDLVLSPKPVRDQVFESMRRWLEAWVTTP